MNVNSETGMLAGWVMLSKSNRFLLPWASRIRTRFIAVGSEAPRSVVFGPLPKTSTGKIQKNLLRDRFRDA